MAFEQDPEMARLAAQTAAERWRDGAGFVDTEPPCPTAIPHTEPSEPAIPEPVKRALRLGVAFGLIHLLAD